MDLSWHAPLATQVNNLSSVVDGTGVYGFIFSSSHTPDGQYGTYNWCNMPHVRRQEYQIPDSSYTLDYVELIHRHHKRTPYASNAFPVEAYPWDCNDSELFYYAQPVGSSSTTPYWTPYTSPVNPFLTGGFAGTCEFPQITDEGLADSKQHGVDLHAVYGTLLDFLPSHYAPSLMSFRVTNNVITSQVAGVLLAGLLPASATASVPVRVQASGIDSLEPQYSCASASALASSIRSTAPGSNWTAHLADLAPLYARLDRVSGVAGASAWHVSFDHYFDNLSARLCHQKALPCNASVGACVSQADADAVFRAGQYEYSFTYRDDARSLAQARAGYGVWAAELAANMRQRVHGAGEVKWRHNVAHDGSVSPLLGLLQVEEMVWPGMGAEVVFEVWRRGRDGVFLRVLWGGRVLRSSSPTLGLMDMIPLERFLDYVDGLVGKNGGEILGLCNG